MKLEQQQIINLILEEKYKIKERAAENGDFKTFSLISQDIRQMEKEIKENALKTNMLR